MIRLKPVPEEKANDYTKSVYEVIKPALQIHLVPLYFQYLGNFPEYLGYLWNIIGPNIGTNGFHAALSQIHQIATSAVEVIYTPSEQARALHAQMHPAEKEQVLQTVAHLRSLNLQMMLLTIAVRESLKGVFITAKQLPDTAPSISEAGQVDKSLDEIVQESLLSISHSTDSPQLETKAANMLVPIYGSNTLMISQYPTFFSLAAEELDAIMKTESYLKTRVEMERITHILLLQLPSPINISYIETAKMLFNKPHADDLLFLMKDTFPAHFPKLVIATEMMQKILQSS